ncbi:class I SAM-dependent methyltransferase [Methylobacterium sp. J-077]|uniref:class I SAM-dependent methyltransferase n=1 Tax=Methylobacterium sp. J-077 TaxID=2836656 RepID=UPI001FBB7754|nr:class I SAM-dependent methyltransferase [Methylobacterium sp. J-077]MCJ2122084.1 class I SAM-dependent methyltransferase [Methylobacterium sp. J-077]
MKSIQSQISYLTRMALKDPRLIWANLRERLLFDWIYKVDTVRQISKENYSTGLANLKYGLHYSSSWTSEIVFGYKSSRQHLNSRFESFHFYDVGCGKGKVQIVWKQLLHREGLLQNVGGIDYYEDVLAVARNNHFNLFGDEGIFIQADASEFAFCSGGSLILYLYNPFDDVVLRPMINNLRSNEVFLIYNNPVYEYVLLEAGFMLIERKDGFHPQSVTRTYYRSPAISNDLRQSGI